ncbi:LysR family transcriptional regulator [Clostridium sp.]|jgi:molybdate transport repressor ModE-like protein|uniref:LysR family transcriptional regulator n=1 Tax=Clostridium sp. TaxID=1506 RepID=UPI003A480190
MHIDIELKTLKIMLTIEQQGSFSKAAKKLYISQPALTQYIKRVESSLSFPLYNRENGKCIPTEPAKILLKEGKVLLEQYDSMLRKVQNIANSNTTNIHLGWPVGYTLHYLNSIMSSVSQLNSTNVTLTENSLENLIELLLERKLNFLLVPALYYHPDLVYTTIRREEFYLAVPKNHIANSLINKNGLTNYADLSKLKNMPFISLYAKAYEHFINPLFHEAGYRPNIVLKCINWDSSHALVENGFGLSIVPYWFAEKGHKKINYYHIKSNYRTYRIFACVYHRNQVISPELQSFIDCIKNIYGDKNAYMPFDYSTLSEKL